VLHTGVTNGINNRRYFSLPHTSTRRKWLPGDSEVDWNGTEWLMDSRRREWRKVSGTADVKFELDLR